MAGCNGNKSQTASAPDAGATAKTTPAQEPASAKPAVTPEAQAAASPMPDPLRGKVKETMNAAGYTYVLMATERGDVWAAASTFAVAVGDEVEMASIIPMHDFHSRKLDRTFDVIQFVGSARVMGGTATATAAAPTAQLPPGHPPVAGATTASKPGEATTPKVAKIEKLADGLTVAELFGKKAELSGKSVKFRGRVVKASRGILGKNWLHIQDGTGAAGTNDITVTSLAGFAAPGTVVIIEGTLGLDRDFTAGYVYDVIVEDATVTAE